MEALPAERPRVKDEDTQSEGEGPHGSKKKSVMASSLEGLSVALSAPSADTAGATPNPPPFEPEVADISGARPTEGDHQGSDEEQRPDGSDEEDEEEEEGAEAQEEEREEEQEGGGGGGAEVQQAEGLAETEAGAHSEKEWLQLFEAVKQHLIPALDAWEAARVGASGVTLLNYWQCGRVFHFLGACAYGLRTDPITLLSKVNLSPKQWELWSKTGPDSPYSAAIRVYTTLKENCTEAELAAAGGFEIDVFLRLAEMNPSDECVRRWILHSHRVIVSPKSLTQYPEGPPLPPPSAKVVLATNKPKRLQKPKPKPKEPEPDVSASAAASPSRRRRAPPPRRYRNIAPAPSPPASSASHSLPARHFSPLPASALAPPHPSGRGRRPAPVDGWSFEEDKRLARFVIAYGYGELTTSDSSKVLPFGIVRRLGSLKSHWSELRKKKRLDSLLEATHAEIEADKAAGFVRLLRDEDLPPMDQPLLYEKDDPSSEEEDEESEQRSEDYDLEDPDEEEEAEDNKQRRPPQEEEEEQPDEEFDTDEPTRRRVLWTPDEEWGVVRAFAAYGRPCFRFTSEQLAPFGLAHRAGGGALKLRYQHLVQIGAMDKLLAQYKANPSDTPPKDMETQPAVPASAKPGTEHYYTKEEDWAIARAYQDLGRDFCIMSAEQLAPYGLARRAGGQGLGKRWRRLHESGVLEKLLKKLGAASAKKEEVPHSIGTRKRKQAEAAAAAEEKEKEPASKESKADTEKQQEGGQQSESAVLS